MTIVKRFEKVMAYVLLFIISIPIFIINIIRDPFILLAEWVWHVAESEDETWAE